MNSEIALNKIVISPRFTAYFETCSSISQNCPPNQFLDFLLSESANLMYIPEWEAELINLDISTLSHVAKSHIVVVDKNKKIFSNTKRIIAEVDNSISWAESTRWQQINVLNHLFETLYHIQLAVQLTADADISQPYQLFHEIDGIIPISTDRETRSFLNEIKGFLKIYSKIEVPGIIYSPKQNLTSIEKQVKILIQDSDFLSLSHQRYELETPHDISILKKLLTIARKISYNKKYREFIKYASLTNHYLPSTVQPVGDFLIENVLSEKGFNPMIVDIDTITYEADLNSARKNDPNNFDENGEVIEPCCIPFPLSVYSIPGRLIHKM